MEGVTESEYQFEVNPHTIDMWWDHTQILHPLADGLTKQYSKGFKLKGILTWRDKVFIRRTQMESFIDIFNLTSGITVHPFPSSRSSAQFGITWNQPMLDFHLVEGVSPIGYYGTIQFEGTLMYDTIPKTWVTADG
jgi:hypothetical protein